MFDSLNIPQLWNDAVNWCGQIFWSINTIYELILLITAFCIATILHKAIKPQAIAQIERHALPHRAEQILKNISKLFLPSITLILIVLGSGIFNALTIDTNITGVITKLLGAWIIIRAALQLVENSLVRNIFAFSIWGIAALSIFGVLTETNAALDSIGFSIGDFRLSALAVIKGAFSLFILLYIALFASGFAERRIFKVASLTRTSQVLVAKIVRVALIVFALLIGVSSAGIDLSIFAVFGGAIGLGIGFGLQKVISNLFSGMLLLMDRSIKPGDVIELPDLGTFGWVNKMAARYTEIMTRDNKSFLIPNEDFITQRVVNWSHGNSLIRLQVHFGVHYDSDPHLVKKIAEEAAMTPDRVVNNPAPVCWLVEFGDSALNFSLRFWIKDAEAGVTNIRGTVMMALWDKFKEHGVQIPYPQRELYIHEKKAL